MSTQAQTALTALLSYLSTQVSAIENTAQSEEDSFDIKHYSVDDLPLLAGIIRYIRVDDKPGQLTEADAAIYLEVYYIDWTEDSSIKQGWIDTIATNIPIELSDCTLVFSVNSTIIESIDTEYPLHGVRIPLSIKSLGSRANI